MNNRIYIAGKITGDNDYKAKFKSARYNIEMARHNCSKSRCQECPFYDRNYVTACRIFDLFPDYFEIVNPVDFHLEGKPYWITMLICRHKLRNCSYVYFLNDWEQSRGAKMEHRWALRWKKRIIYQQ